VASLAAEAQSAFEKENLLEPAVVKRNIHSSIFNIKGNEALYQKLRQNNIICSQRGEGLRVSFHYFNTSGDLREFLKAVK